MLRNGVKDLTVSDLLGKTWVFTKFFFGNRVNYENDVENIKGMYQLIMANDVFEHLHYPIKTLKMLENQLLPKGKIIGNVALDIGGPHLKSTIERKQKIYTFINNINKRKEHES